MNLDASRGHHQSESSASPAGESPAPYALRILIAEDSPDNRMLLEAYLKNAPHTVAFVEDGVEAIDAFCRETYDLILMDLQMPRMDGLTATRKIREIETAQSLKRTTILALSANARPEDIAISHNSGCDGHLSKPISKAKLLASIDEYGAYRSSSQPSESGVAAELHEAAVLYVQRRKEEAPRLLELLASNQLDPIRVAGHNLKGTGASYGFPRLSSMGAAIEASAKSSDLDALASSLKELAGYLDTITMT